MTNYVVVKAIKGFVVGQVIEIGNSNMLSRLTRSGSVLPASHPLLAANAPLLEPIDADLVYRLAKMTVGEMEAAVLEIEDRRVLDVIEVNDGRVGVTTAVVMRVAQLMAVVEGETAVSDGLGGD